MDIRENLKIISLQFTIPFFHLIEWLKVIVRYYRNVNFALIDLTILILSFWYNPFRLCRLYRESREKTGEKDLEHYTYGETPLTTMDHIFDVFQIKPKQKVLEMGSGRGRAAFFLSEIKDCKVTGIENVPTLYQISLKAYNLFKPKNIEFLLEDFFLTNLSIYDVIYLFGTTLSDRKIAILTERFKECPKGTKIITVSFPLNSDQFEITGVIMAKFDFGLAEVYQQIRV